MRKIIILLVLLATLAAFTVTPALANGWWGWPPPPYQPPYTGLPSPTDFGPYHVAGGPHCAGSLPSVLVAPGTGRIAERFSTLRYYPAGPAIRVVYNDYWSAPETFDVVAGPVCAGYGPLAWYYIRYHDPALGEGWASESQNYSIYGNFRYWLLP